MSKKLEELISGLGEVDTTLKKFINIDVLKLTDVLKENLDVIYDQRNILRAFTWQCMNGMIKVTDKDIFDKFREFIRKKDEQYIYVQMFDKKDGNEAIKIDGMNLIAKKIEKDGTYINKWAKTKALYKNDVIPILEVLKENIKVVDKLVVYNDGGFVTNLNDIKAFYGADIVGEGDEVYEKIAKLTKIDVDDAPHTPPDNPTATSPVPPPDNTFGTTSVTLTPKTTGGSSDIISLYNVVKLKRDINDKKNVDKFFKCSNEIYNGYLGPENSIYNTNAGEKEANLYNILEDKRKRLWEVLSFKDTDDNNVIAIIIPRKYYIDNQIYIIKDDHYKNFDTVCEMILKYNMDLLNPRYENVDISNKINKIEGIQKTNLMKIFMDKNIEVKINDNDIYTFENCTELYKFLINALDLKTIDIYYKYAPNGKLAKLDPDTPLYKFLNAFKYFYNCDLEKNEKISDNLLISFNIVEKQVNNLDVIRKNIDTIDNMIKVLTIDDNLNSYITSLKSKINESLYYLLYDLEKDSDEIISKLQNIEANKLAEKHLAATRANQSQPPSP